MGKCNVKGLGIAIGALGALYMVLLGLGSMLWGWGTPLLEAMSSLYIGYAPTLMGIIIGGIWAFFDGFIAGAVIAWVYNKVT